MKPYLKNQAKTSGSVAQVAEHFPSKYNALTSNPSTTKTKQNKNFANNQRDAFFFSVGDQTHAC
jgi:hypothetical protein